MKRLRVLLLAQADALEAQARTFRTMAEEADEATQPQSAAGIDYVFEAALIEQGWPAEWLGRLSKTGRLEVRLVGRKKAVSTASLNAAVRACPPPRSVKARLEPADEVQAALQKGALRIVGGRRR